MKQTVYHDPNRAPRRKKRYPRWGRIVGVALAVLVLAGAAIVLPKQLRSNAQLPGPGSSADGANSTPAESDANPDTPPEGQPGATMPQEPEEDLTPMRFVDTEGANLAAGNENGYYELVSANAGYLLYYTDYNTHQRLVLCSNPACTHQDSNCPAWFSRPGLPFLYNDKLYILRDSNFDSGVEKDEAFQQLIGMELDGSNRRTIVRFSFDEEILGNMLMQDGYLYAIQQCLIIASETDISLSRYVIKVALESGDIERLQEVDSYGFLLGGYGNNLVMKTIDFKIPDVGEDSDAVANDQQHVLYSIDATSGNITELMRWRQGDIQIKIDRQQPYYAYQMVPGDGCCNLQKIDLRTVEFLPWQQSVPAVRPDTAMLRWLGGKYLEVLVYEEANNEAGQISRSYMIDSETAEVQERSLTYSPKQLPYSVLAATEHQFLVCSDTREEPYTIMIDGQTDQGVNIVAVYSLIDQQDLFHNNNNVTLIEDIG